MLLLTVVVIPWSFVVLAAYVVDNFSLVIHDHFSSSTVNRYETTVSPRYFSRSIPSKRSGNSETIAEYLIDPDLSTLINFTPGTRSNADYTGEADPNFVSSQVIFDSIGKKEREDPHGLNGCILLFHLGSGPGRKDKFHHRFGELLDYLAGKGYQFVRVDELLEPKPEVTTSSKSPQSPTEARPGDGR